MAKGANQKLKLLYLMKILMERTDENHKMSMAEIIEALEANEISAERKSIYNDIECLKDYGIDVIKEPVRGNCYYYIGSREFELAELKLLVDAVQSAKFITARKSNELIKKLENFGSRHEAKQLQRQVFVTERVKTMNESIFYNVDHIHTAIGANSRIRFQYFQWTVEKKMELKRDGAFYEVSPWALSWDDEYYYMVAYDSAESKIKHFRVDKMTKISATNEPREGKETFEQFDMAVYAKKMFGMYSGQEEKVDLVCENDLVGVIIDRFGKDIPFMRVDDEHFKVIVPVSVSQVFLGWVVSLGGKAVIAGPQSVVEQMKKLTRDLAKQYT